MSDTEQNIEGVNWKIALQVWWAQMWRQMAVDAIASSLLVAFSSILPKPKGDRTDAWVLYIALFALIIPTVIWSVWRSLKVDYGLFSITIKQRENDEGVTWKVALRVWWAQTWRQIVVLIIISVLAMTLLRYTLKHYSVPVLVAVMTNNVITFLFSILVSIWAVWQGLRVNYKSFSISIRHKKTT